MADKYYWDNDISDNDIVVTTGGGDNNVPIEILGIASYDSGEGYLVKASVNKFERYHLHMYGDTNFRSQKFSPLITI